MDREQIKKALRIAVNVGCGFEGDAEDAKSILALIVDLEAEVERLKREQLRLQDESDNQQAEIAKLNGWVDELIEAGNDLIESRYKHPDSLHNAGYLWSALVGKIKMERDE